MVLLTKFAIAVLNARKIFEYHPGEVSEAVSVSARWYQKSESGERLPCSVTMIRIILFLFIDVEDLREEAELFVPIHSI